jgi:hypothetical protein
MKLKILKESKNKPFKTDEGDEMNYFWTTCEREDGVQIQIGSINDFTASVGQVLDLNIVKVERRDGKVGYKEVK